MIVLAVLQTVRSLLGDSLSGLALSLANLALTNTVSLATLRVKFVICKLVEMPGGQRELVLLNFIVR